MKTKKQTKNKKDERDLIGESSIFFIGAMVGMLILGFIFIVTTPQDQANIDTLTPKEMMEQAPTPPYTPSDATLCSVIRGTPAWAKDGQIIAYGYNEVETETLEDQNVAFLYHPDCIHCQRQVEYWGEDDFNQLSSRGLAIDCTRY
jgi:hypothetical protein